MNFTIIDDKCSYKLNKTHVDRTSQISRLIKQNIQNEILHTLSVIQEIIRHKRKRELHIS